MNPEQQLALEDVSKGHNIFITGGAGVGKSYLVNEIVKSTNKKIGVCAMTGCAALLINGATLHSYLAIGLATDPAKVLANKVRKFVTIVQRILDLDILLIDEVSMLNDELFEKVYEFLQLVRKNDKPFGGVQMVFVGDPFQLAPVDGNYCFTSKLWKNIKIHTLTQNMRQAGDQDFKDLLDRVRWGKCSTEDLDTLQKLKTTTFPDGIIPTRLYSKNINVDAINQSELNKLSSETREYLAGHLNESSKKWATSNKIPEKSLFKVGAQVMCTRNIPTLGLVNGSRGVVTSLDSDAVVIRLLNGEIVRLAYITVIPFDNPYISVQFLPLKLAWAITIHSSQGMTIDALEVDLGRDIFACGQAYTGLSRAKSLSTVRVTSVLASSFVTSPIIKKLFMTASKIRV
jgi:ATP-dependent DNA helicase PIF1